MADLRIDIVANLSDLKRGLNDAKAQFKNASAEISQGFTGITNIAKQAAIAIGAVTGSLFAMVKTAANTGDELAKMSVRTGANITFLSEMNHVLQLSGSNIKEFEISLRLLSRRMLDAATGSDEAVATFNRLGVDVKDTSGNLRKLEDVFNDLVVGLNKITSDTEQSALAMELFGRSGTMLLPTIKSGADAIAKMREEAHALGLTWSDIDARAAEEFNDNLERLKGALIGIKNETAKALFPILTQWIVELTDKAKLFIATELPGYLVRLRETIPGIAEKIKDIALGFRDVVYWIKEHFDLVIIIGEIVLALKALQMILAAYHIVNGLIAMASAFKMLSIAMLTNPVGLAGIGIALAITGIALAFKNLRTEADTSYLDTTTQKFGQLGAAVDKSRVALELYQKFQKQGKLAPEEEAQVKTLFTPIPSPTGVQIEIGKPEPVPKPVYERPKLAPETEAKIFPQQAMIVVGVGFEFLDTEKLEHEIPEKIQPIRDAVAEMTLEGRDLWRAMLNQWKTDNEQFINDFAQATSQIANISRMLADYNIQESQRVANEQIRKIRESATNRINIIQDQVKRGVKTEKQAAAEIAIIQADLSNNVTSIQERAAERERQIKRRMKPILIMEAIANTAVAVTKALPNLILAALTAAAGAVQVGIIAAQKYALGGLITPSNARDIVPAMLTPGEVVVRREVVRQYGEANVARFAKTGEMPDATSRNVNIVINAIDAKSFDEYLRNTGRQAMIEFVEREKRMRTI